ncbi:thioesterase family protein [Salinicola sp. DM10]|uniref:acyl-CoA thioesterase n=1 Tax=Salinicola sp. DM10 TaxID=2815721 RepID=UPI001A8CF3C4|nr:thioesterase family protein [Salinicola sp. DM10]MCE3026868.1 acyl-CoA thioesterase [Salinicola sp. DM10]
MSWDLPRPFLLDIAVEASHIDHYGHVNNAEYLRWVEQASWAHSRSLGLSLDDYRALDRGMVVHRHELDYLAPAFEGDGLEIATWIVACDGRLTLTRRFQLRHGATGATLLRAQTRFACIELSSGRARRMPARFVEVYGEAVTSPAIS